MKNVLMNTDMTKAILDGRKTQTRRVVKCGLYAIPNDMNEHNIEVSMNYCDLDENNHPELKSEMIKHAKYKIGETLWVREPAKVTSVHGVHFDFKYLADDDKTFQSMIKIPSRFRTHQPGGSIVNYPKWISNHQGIPNGCIKEMARIFLKITDVRVERLQDITSDDIQKEGVFFDEQGLARHHDTDDEFNIRVCDEYHLRWEELWNSTAPKGYKWEDNPYVFVYEFER